MRLLSCDCIVPQWGPVMARPCPSSRLTRQERGPRRSGRAGTNAMPPVFREGLCPEIFRSAGGALEQPLPVPVDFTLHELDVLVLEMVEAALEPDVVVDRLL